MKELKGFADRDIVDEEFMSDITGKYKGKSENQLIDQLLELVKQGRQDGTFSDSQLDDFIALVSPQLDDNGRKKLDDLASLIRNE